MANKPKKQPKILAPLPLQGKQVAVNKAVAEVAFNFRYLRDDYGVKDLDCEALKAFTGKLHLFGQQTWAELGVKGKWNGFELIPKKQIKGDFPTVFDHLGEAAVMRLGQKGRLIGFYTEPVFFVVWIDPNHDVYKG